jgi:hypothetical protein
MFSAIPERRQIDYVTNVMGSGFTSSTIQTRPEAAAAAVVHRLSQYLSVSNGPNDILTLGLMQRQAESLCVQIGARASFATRVARI